MEVNESVEARGASFPIRGQCDPRFQPVLEAFKENYRVEDETGSSVSVIVDGETVVDLWGGYRNGDKTEPWDAHTTVCMMSVAKGITGICFNMLVDRGEIDIDAPVATYWPEFAKNGKDRILVRHILDHTAAIPVLTNNRLYPGGMFDREAYVKALEDQEPLWEPGTRAAYHVHNQGYLLGEIMRRVCGKTVGPFLRSEVAGPLARRILYRRHDGGGAEPRRRGDAEYGRAAVRGEGRPDAGGRGGLGRRDSAPAGLPPESGRALAYDAQLEDLARGGNRQRQRPRQCPRRLPHLRRGGAPGGRARRRKADVARRDSSA